MSFALLWQDNTAAPIEEQVLRAAVRYHDKYDQGWPNVCRVHPSQIEGSDKPRVFISDDLLIRVLPDPYTRPGQVLIWQEDASD